MTCSQRHWTILLLLLAVISSGCYSQAALQKAEDVFAEEMRKPFRRDKPVTTDGVEVVIQTGHTGDLTAVALSPNGRYILSGAKDGTVKVWDVASGLVRHTFAVHALGGGGPERLQFTSDGTKAIVQDISGRQVFDVTTGLQVKVDGLRSMDVFPDGQLEVREESGNHKVYDVRSGKETRLEERASEVTDLAVTGDGRSVVAGMGGGRAVLWDLTTGQLVRIFECLGGKHVHSVTVSPISPLLSTGCRDGSAWLWELTTGRQIRNLAPPLPEDSFTPTVRFSRDGRTLALGVGEQLSLWEVATANELRRVTIPRSWRLPGMVAELYEQDRTLTLPPDRAAVALNQVSTLALHPDGQHVAMVHPYEEISLWDMKTGQLVRRFGSDTSVGATSNLVFSPDGRVLVALVLGRVYRWDVATGQEIRGSGEAQIRTQVDSLRQMKGEGLAVSADGRFAAHDDGGVIKVSDLASGMVLHELIGHTSVITHAVTFASNGRVLISGGSDSAVRLWDLQSGKELVALFALGREDFVTVTPDQYYRASKSRIKGVAFEVGDQQYPFEQFDLRFNRPDLVLARLGLAQSELIQSYRLAYEKRLKKMGVTEQMLGRDFHLPEVEVLTKDVPVSVDTATLTLRVKATDNKSPLDRLNVFVNDIPIYGTAGLPLPTKQLKTHEQALQVPLVAGRNKVQVSVLNQQGGESLKQTVYTTSTAQVAPPEVYVVAIGVSEYQNKAYNLRYAAKDAQDFLKTYKAIEQRPGTKSRVHVLDLTNQKATRAEILKAKDWLRQSKINDLVVVFAAGHGMTDEQSNYYFGTYDIDPTQPGTKGLPYEEFENLLDGIPALQKLLLLDTCFSGEIDKDQAVVVAKAEAGGSGTVKMRAFKAARGVTVTAGTSGANTGTAGASQLSQNMLAFQQDWFADLRRGTGAAVISSSSGNEYSLEGEQWKNGVFTYALLNGLKNHGADANKDQTITVSELQGYVIDQVRKLTQGGQNPTVRHENLEYDFAVY